MYDRMGALFIDYLKRSIAVDDNDVTSFIFYIHKNAVHHHPTQKIGEWKFYCYPALISNQKTDLEREEVIEWFGSVEQFIRFHKQTVDLKNKPHYFE